MRGEKTKDWKKSNFKETVVNAETQHNVSIPSENKMETLFTALGDYYQREKKETLNEQEQIALFMYLTGYYGVYWLGDY
ncbi:MAG: hypothetical protein LBI53_07555 [Candidatus Peribacteria bacterium]|jgi:hypothetical protein|nr:hypothetical protein [Candidatus Peribacteria bacterium]